MSQNAMCLGLRRIAAGIYDCLEIRTIGPRVVDRPELAKYIHTTRQSQLVGYLGVCSTCSLLRGATTRKPLFPVERMLVNTNWTSGHPREAKHDAGHKVL